jgi:hypothetical protein
MGNETLLAYIRDPSFRTNARYCRTLIARLTHILSAPFALILENPDELVGQAVRDHLAVHPNASIIYVSNDCTNQVPQGWTP